MATSSKISRVRHEGIEAKLHLMHKRLPILLILYPNAAYSQKELAGKTDIDEGNFSRCIKELEETGFVSTHRKKAKGNDRKMVNLTDLSIEVLSSFFKREKPTPTLEPLTDENYMDSTLQLLNEKDQEVRRIAARELVNISRSYIIPPRSGLFTYLENELIEEEDREVLSHLLEALSTTIINSPETREKVISSLTAPLCDIAKENGKVIDRRITDLAVKTLAAVYEGEYRYDLLLPIYKELINHGSQSSRTVVDSLIGNHPEKRKELRQSLLEIFKEATEDRRNLIKGHLTII